MSSASRRTAGLIGYAGLAVLDTLAILASKPKARRLVKPALMPALAGSVASSSPVGRKVSRALALSGAGDAALLGKSRWAFLSGAASFAGAHVTYLSAMKDLGDRPGMLRYRPWLAAPYAVALAGFAAVVPKVAKRTGWGEAAAGLAYAGLLTSVATVALDLRGRRGDDPEWDRAATRAAAGGALFVASDFLVGLQRYLKSDNRAIGAGVMITYTAAQGLLATGLTELAERSES
ncbi:lysoplasmalogenase family protein [Longispora albida]|uniref:lysoplasmalogenase family protein n=1 Tax=Longispora albida TaxID=203523 RepID=UPI00036B5ABB|nr:lysoplasmalogenase family protein [Longispora albida]